MRRKRRTRIFFCTDIHGSEACFRKFLHAGSAYEADVLILGGDCTGKMIIPLAETEPGTFSVTWSGRTAQVSGDALERIEGEIRNSGMYPVRVTESELAELEADPAARDELFSRVMIETVQRWLELAKDRLGDSGLHVILTPGNDDEWAVDAVLTSSDFVDAAEGRVVRVGQPGDEYEMLSLGWANETPWNTPRECSEGELSAKIRSLAEQVEDMDRAIFNIHVPPFGTGLDVAPELEEGTRMKRGGTMMAPVGSTAVRDAILEYQPMLSLHGHIHESRGVQRLGRTVSVNPGSVYQDWDLQGVVVDLVGGNVEQCVPTSG